MTASVVPSPMTPAQKLASLRQAMTGHQLDAYLVPSSDQHQNEYAPLSERRLRWLTGFTGSSGLAIVTLDRAAIFVDGRYTLQAASQVDAASIETLNWEDEVLSTWLAAVLRRGGQIGFDPWLHRPDQVTKLEIAAAPASSSLIAIEPNLIDQLWRDRPSAPMGTVRLLDNDLTGQSAAAKIETIRETLQADEQLVITDPHEIAWMLNLRGADLDYTPVALGYAILPKAGKPLLYIDPGKIASPERSQLQHLVSLATPAQLLDDLSRKKSTTSRYLLDDSTAAIKLQSAIRASGSDVDIRPSQIKILKARKNANELACARKAHLSDAIAWATYLRWLEMEAPKGLLTEIDAATCFEAIRRDVPGFQGLSFSIISAFGPHAALPHYRPTPETNATIGDGIYLVDSGAQYPGATTDLTRTLAFGKPNQEMRDRYTRVLKGHIAVATAIFPQGSTGIQIDTLARIPLWSAGLDFNHGTGHGIGAGLSVHEGPQEISKAGHHPLEAGMFLSNEPGYYKAGAWGIRLENLVAVVPRPIAGSEQHMLGFETLSLVPFYRQLIDGEMLTTSERAWLRSYHQAVREAATPHLDPALQTWLERATAPLDRDKASRK